MSDVTPPNPDGHYPPEPKVVAASLASYVVSLLVTAAMTLAQDERVPLLIGFLPEALEPFALAVFPAVSAFVLGWLAKHQHRRPRTTV